MITLCAVASPAAAERVEVLLLYNIRPPYVELAPGGRIVGLTATPAIAAFEAAEIPFTLRNAPTNRQLALVRGDAEPSCAIGWFKRPERMTFAHFTRPIYQDQPNVVLMRRSMAEVIEHQTVKALMSDRRWAVLLRQNFSYGGFIDHLIAQHLPRRIESVGSKSQFVEMIRKGRADYMFVAREEAAWIMGSMEASDVVAATFSDMPAGDTRHIMCGMSVPEDVIQRLDAVLPVRGGA